MNILCGRIKVNIILQNCWIIFMFVIFYTYKKRGDEMSDIYSRIKTRRIELNMTQNDLAEKLGYKEKSIISKIENGKSDIPQSKLEAFAEALDTTVQYLMGYDPEGSMMQRTAARIADFKEQLKNATDETEIADLEYAIAINEESYEDIKFINRLTFNYEISQPEHLKNNAMKKFGDIFGNVTEKENPDTLSEDEEQLVAAFRKLDPILRKYILFSVVNASQFSDITTELDRIENEYRASRTQQRHDEAINAR